MRKKFRKTEMSFEESGEVIPSARLPLAEAPLLFQKSVMEPSKPSSRAAYIQQSVRRSGRPQPYPQLEVQVMSVGKPPTTTLDSPTFGAATAMAGASLESPRVPSGPMGAPSGQHVMLRRSSSLSSSSYVAPTVSLPPPEAFAGGDTDRKAGSASEAPRRESLSPSKRSRRESGGAASASSTSTGTATVRAAPDPSPSLDEAEEESVEGLGSPKKRPSLGKRESGAAVAERAAAAASAPPSITIVDMFTPGMLRVNVFRIPSLLPLPSGVVLSFAEARPQLVDHGVINIVMRRSTDAGRTWGLARVCVEGAMVGGAAKFTVGNPTAVYDKSGPRPRPPHHPLP